MIRLPRRAMVIAFLFVAAPSSTGASAQEMEAPSSRPFGSFTFGDSVHVPLPRQEAYDRFLEVDRWWDHHVSPDPSRFYIEARPGGGFYEIFDSSGDGVLHATVIFARRGETLRMRGPLGLSGFALDMVYNLDFREDGSGTWVVLTVRGSGELEDAWPGVVQRVWHHFLAERFKPYAEGVLN